MIACGETVGVTKTQILFLTANVECLDEHKKIMTDICDTSRVLATSIRNQGIIQPLVVRPEVMVMN
jgi:hypothetical protein